SSSPSTTTAATEVTATPVTSAGAVVTTAAPTTVAPTTAAAPTSAAAPPAAPAPDPTTVLQAALDGLSTAYHFVSTVTLDGAVALTADGDRVGDGSRLTLSSRDGTVSYVITPDGSWVMPEGGEWQPVETDPADTDPISALRTPATVQSGATDGSTSHLAVTVSPSALGVPGDAPVPLDVTVTAAVLSGVTYATTVAGKPATVTSTFGPVQDPSPVTAPG
ncbi:MAG TPA: hypothetical protein VGF22_18965, partial [Acidimicrobiales bacterium]